MISTDHRLHPVTRLSARAFHLHHVKWCAINRRFSYNLQHKQWHRT